MKHWKRPILGLIVVGLVLGLHVAPSIAKKKKGGGSSQNQRVAQEAIRVMKIEVAAAKVTYQAATAKANQVAGYVQQFQANVAQTHANLQDAESHSQTASASLKLVEQRLLNKVDAETYLGRANKMAAEAEQAYQIARTKAYESAYYKTRYQTALKSNNRIQLISELRKETENSPAFSAARDTLDATRREQALWREKLLSQNENWKAAAKAAREARAKEAEIKQARQNALLKLSGARQSLRNAQKTAAHAAFVIKDGTAVVKALEASSKKMAQQQRNRNNSRNRSSGNRR